MSKIFDSMRRAEDERRRKASKPVDPAEPVIAVPPRVAAVPRLETTGRVPGALFRQMGILRNSIEVGLAGKNKRTILFASAMPREGTTTIATNFARVLALQGQKRVLVCEMNARSPKFAELFSINGDAGVTEYFSGTSRLNDFVHTSEPDELDVLHVGRQDATIIQLHLNEVFPKLIEESMRTYDTMIIDAPPILDSPETAPMTTFVDGVVVVIQAGKTKREVVARAMESIQKFRGNLLGVVLNRKKYYIPDFLYKRI